MDSERCGPRDGIGDIQRIQRGICGKDGIDPYDAQQTCACQRDDHGDDGVAHAAHLAHHGIHHAAEVIGRADHGHTHQAKADHVRVSVINAQQLCAQRQEDQASFVSWRFALLCG